MRIQRLIPYTFIAVLLSLAYLAISWGLADLSYKQGRYYIEKWQAAGKAPQEEQWERVRGHMQAALNNEPGSPRMLEDMGRLYEWGASVKGRSEEEAVDRRRMALEYYRTSLKQRPVSTWTWASLALTKYNLREFDAEFQYAIRQAVTLGPWVSEVQLIIADIGLGAWWKLPKETQDIVFNTVSRGITWELANLHHAKHRKAIVKTAKHHKRLWLVCREAGLAKLIGKECKTGLGDRRSGAEVQGKRTTGQGPK